jgi:hypothetical protein
MVGPPSGDLPLSEDQPRIKPIPYVGISGKRERWHVWIMWSSDNGREVISLREIRAGGKHVT